MLKYFFCYLWLQYNQRELLSELIQNIAWNLKKKLVNCDLPSMFKVLEKLDLMSKREVDCICLSLKPVYNTLLVITHSKNLH